MISVEEANRRQYDKDIELHDCGYWSVCEDHGCACAISDNVDGFDNDVYQEHKLDLQRLAEEFYDDDDYYADAYYEDEDNYDFMKEMKMKTIKDYVTEGVPYVINSMRERRTTREGSIIFPNGWVASIVHPTEAPEKYSVAICDYDGYFDWEILRKYFDTKNGVVICDNEEEVCTVLECIKNL